MHSVAAPEFLRGSFQLTDNLSYQNYRLAICLFCLAVAAVVFFVIAKTRVGMIVRAAAENRDMTRALGIRSERVNRLVFATGIALAALGGIVVAPLSTVYPGMGDQMLILSFVVVVLGGIGSVAGAAIGALLIGLADTFGQVLIPVGRQHLDLCRDGGGAAVAAERHSGRAGRLMHPLVARASLIILLARRRRAAAAGADLLPAVRHARCSRSASWRWRSISWSASAASSASATARSSGSPAMRSRSRRRSTSRPRSGSTLPLAVGVAATAALAIGALSLRTRGIYFIMVTLAFGEMLFYLFHDNKFAGGSDGTFINIKPEAMVFGVNIIDLDKARVFYWVVLALVVLTILFLHLLTRSPFGRALTASRDNERRARSLGFPIYRVRLTAFVISGALAGVAGYFAAAQFGFVAPQMLGWHQSAIALVMVVLGGMRGVAGPLIGAVVVMGLEE